MSSAVEHPELATPPPGLPPDYVPGTADPYASTDPYGQFRFDPGPFDVSDWLGASPGTNDDSNAAPADGSDDAKPVPSGISEARDVALKY